MSSIKRLDSVFEAVSSCQDEVITGSPSEAIHPIEVVRVIRSTTSSVELSHKMATHYVECNHNNGLKTQDKCDPSTFQQCYDMLQQQKIKYLNTRINQSDLRLQVLQLLEYKRLLAIQVLYYKADLYSEKQQSRKWKQKYESLKKKRTLKPVNVVVHKRTEAHCSNFTSKMDNTGVFSEDNKKQQELEKIAAMPSTEKELDQQNVSNTNCDLNQKGYNGNPSSSLEAGDNQRRIQNKFFIGMEPPKSDTVTGKHDDGLGSIRQQNERRQRSPLRPELSIRVYTDGLKDDSCSMQLIASPQHPSRILKSRIIFDCPDSPINYLSDEKNNVFGQDKQKETTHQPYQVHCQAVVQQCCSNKVIVDGCFDHASPCARSVETNDEEKTKDDAILFSKEASLLTDTSTNCNECLVAKQVSANRELLDKQVTDDYNYSDENSTNSKPSSIGQDDAILFSTEKRQTSAEMECSMEREKDIAKIDGGLTNHNQLITTDRKHKSKRSFSSAMGSPSNDNSNSNVIGYLIDPGNQVNISGFSDTMVAEDLNDTTFLCSLSDICPKASNSNIDDVGTVISEANTIALKVESVGRSPCSLSFSPDASGLENASQFLGPQKQSQQLMVNDAINVDECRVSSITASLKGSGVLDNYSISSESQCDKTFISEVSFVSEGKSSTTSESLGDTTSMRSDEVKKRAKKITSNALFTSFQPPKLKFVTRRKR